MKAKKFIAESIKEAMVLVREEFGDNAFILSNKKVGDKVELIAARESDFDNVSTEVSQSAMSKAQSTLDILVKNSDDGQDSFSDTFVKATKQQSRQTTQQRVSESSALKDYSDLNAIKKPVKPQVSEKKWVTDESEVLSSVQSELSAIKQLLKNQISGLAWQNFQNLSPDHTLIIEKLDAIGVDVSISLRIAALINSIQGVGDLNSHLAQSISKLIFPNNELLFKNKRALSFVGPTGSGKTSVITKMATLLTDTQPDCKIALVNTDPNAIGGAETLSVFGKILDVPVFNAHTPDKIQSLMLNSSDYDYLLIDTAGVNIKDGSIPETWSLLRSIRECGFVTVLPATFQSAYLNEFLYQIKEFNIDANVVTFMDECIQIGNILSAMIHHDLSFEFYSHGPQVSNQLSSINESEFIQLVEDSLQSAFSQKPRDVLAWHFMEQVSNDELS